MPLAVITPGDPVVSVAEFKSFARIDHSLEDTLIEIFLAHAENYAEQITGRALTTTVYELSLEEFSARVIRLPRPKLRDITSITYVNPSGDSIVLASSAYEVDTSSEPARVRPVSGTNWPVTKCAFNAVLIRYSAGYGDADSVPQSIKSAIKLHAADMYEHRQTLIASAGGLTEIPVASKAVDQLLLNQRVWLV